MTTETQQVWNAAEWLHAGGLNSLESVWPEDEPLDDVVKLLEEEAEDNGIVLDGDIREALLDWIEMEIELRDLKGEHLKAYQAYVGEE